MATMATVWMGMGTPLMRDGQTSEIPSLPSAATSRSCSQARQEASRPAIPSVGFQGPCNSRHRHRPVRTRRASPLCTATPVGRLRGFQVLGEDGLARLKGLDAPDGGDVDEDTPGDDTGSEVMDSELARSVRRDRLGRVAVVHPALVEDVTERVDVTRGVAMRRKCEVVGAISLGPRARHVVDDRVQVVRPR